MSNAWFSLSQRLFKDKIKIKERKTLDLPRHENDTEPQRTKHVDLPDFTTMQLTEKATFFKTPITLFHLIGKIWKIFDGSICRIATNHI